jgi:hypothetical protein
MNKNVPIWESMSPHASVEFVHDLPKVNVFCTLSEDKAYGPFFRECTILV